MTHVVRRKQPRHDGTRYYNDRGPCARDPNGGAEYDSAEEADAARRGLREPHLWDVLPMHEAAALDIGARAEAKREAWRNLSSASDADPGPDFSAPIRLNPEEWAAVVDLCENPPEPTEALRRIMRGEQKS